MNTKVYIQGSALIHELDRASRQMRLLKDNIYLLETNLTEKIRLNYDKELDSARVQLADIKKQFHEYQESVSAMIKAKVRQEQNTIDGVMKKTAARFKDLAVPTKVQEQQQLEEKKKVRNSSLAGSPDRTGARGGLR